jgi:hypothetical protein
MINFEAIIKGIANNIPKNFVQIKIKKQMEVNIKYLFLIDFSLTRLR